MFDRRLSSDRTRAIAAPLHYAPTSVVRSLDPTPTGAVKMARQLEKFVRPRLAFLHAGPGRRRLFGAIVIAGLGLMLPLPIPFSNHLPAWAVVLLSIGMMEQDGLCVLLGHLTAIFAWVFIA